MVNYERLNKYIDFLNNKQTTCFTHNGKKYNCKRFCPHKGYDLKNIKPDGNGIIKCPSHQWEYNIESGECINGDKLTTIRIFSKKEKP